MALIQEPSELTTRASVSHAEKRRFRRAFEDAAVMLEIVGAGVIAVAVWYGLGTLHIVSTLYISTPHATYSALANLITSGTLGYNYWATMEATLIAFAIGASAGIVAGLSLAMLPRTERVLQPYISALYSLPRIALAPIFILFFGIGLQAKVACGISLTFFILLVTSRAGVVSVDEDVMLLTEMMGLSKLHRFRKVLLPVAMPSIFGGLRLGLIYSLLGVVTSEIIASKAGLGQLIITYSGTFDMAAVYAILFVLAMSASLANVVIARLEKWILRYEPPSRR